MRRIKKSFRTSNLCHPRVILFPSRTLRTIFLFVLSLLSYLSLSLCYAVLSFLFVPKEEKDRNKKTKRREKRESQNRNSFRKKKKSEEEKIKAFLFSSFFCFLLSKKDFVINLPHNSNSLSNNVLDREMNTSST